MAAAANGYELLHALMCAEETAKHLNDTWMHAAEKANALRCQFDEALAHVNVHRERVAALIDAGLRAEASVAAPAASPEPEASAADHPDSTGYTCWACEVDCALWELSHTGLCAECVAASEAAPEPAPDGALEVPDQLAEPTVDAWADEACVGEHLPGRIASVAPRALRVSRDELAQRAVDHVLAAGTLGHSELVGYLTAALPDVPDEEAGRRAVDAMHIARRRELLWYADGAAIVLSRSVLLDRTLVRVVGEQADGIGQALLLEQVRRELAGLAPPVTVSLSEAGKALARLVAAGRLSQRGLTVRPPKPRTTTLSAEQIAGLRSMLRAKRSINSIAKATGLSWSTVNDFALAEGLKRA